MQATAQHQEFLQDQQLSLVVTELHAHDLAYLTKSVRMTKSQIVLGKTPARIAVGRHVWLEVILPTGAIKVLARVTGRSMASTTYNIKHMWPTDRKRYEAFLAS